MLLRIIFFLMILGFLPSACGGGGTLTQEGIEEEQAGNTTQALYRYDLAIRENPKDYLAHARKGLLLSQDVHSWGVAISHLERALEGRPQDEEIRIQLFLLYLGLEYTAEAEAILMSWKTEENSTYFRDFEALYHCDRKPSRLKPYADVVLNSELVPEIWKNRCHEKASR